MILNVHVGTRTVATLYRERDEYVLRYLPEAAAADFVSLTMPVREQPWKWPQTCTRRSQQSRRYL